MTFVTETRASDSPYVESVTAGWSVSSGAPIRPAETHWHMILTRHDGGTQFLIAGPLTSSGVVEYGAGAELLWIKLRLGTFMPHLPPRTFVNAETLLPDASSRAFWLKGSAWEFPTYENTDDFVNRLMREGILQHDPLIGAALDGRLQPGSLSPRTLRHRFLQATGQTQGQIVQFERAQRAAALLQSGVSILDTVEEAGYFDQPHLTRSLKQFIGYTPAQIARLAMAGVGATHRRIADGVETEA